MKPKMIIRICVDIAMTAALLVWHGKGADRKNFKSVLKALVVCGNEYIKYLNEGK